MKRYEWSPEKNEWLKRERGVGFEDVVFHIEAGDEVDLFEHPNQRRYPGQKISVVLIEGYHLEFVDQRCLHHDAAGA